MDRQATFFTLVALWAASTSAQGQSALPPPVVNGLSALQNGHCADAFEAWTSTWTGSEEASKRETLRGSCTYLDRLGGMQGYEILESRTVGTRLVFVYAVLLYSNQPVFLLLIAYRPKDEWKVISVNWNTTAEKVLPPSMLPPKATGQ